MVLLCQLVVERYDSKVSLCSGTRGEGRTHLGYLRFRTVEIVSTFVEQGGRQDLRRHRSSTKEK
jgi:hypothetical protein